MGWIKSDGRSPREKDSTSLSFRIQEKDLAGFHQTVVGKSIRHVDAISFQEAV
jgi:hypothetical protein